MEFTDSAVADQFADETVQLARTALGAGLEDSAVPLHGLGDGAALGHGQGERLLAVDVFPRRGRHDRRDRVPVIGGGDADRIDVVACDDVPEVHVSVTTLVAACPALLSVVVVDDAAGRLTAEPGAFPAFLVPVAVLVTGLDHVADRLDLDVVLRQEGPHVVGAHSADPDESHGDALAGRRGAGFAQG